MAILTVTKKKQGASFSLSTTTLPALLTLPTATTARTTLTYLSSRTSLFSAYLRHITTFSLFSAYLLSPRRLRHPYLLYTSILAFVAGPGVDFVVRLKEGSDQRRELVELEAQGEEVNGEMVRKAVERMKGAEAIRAGVVGVAFAMNVVGIWGERK